MAPVKPGSYIFDPKSITNIRNKLNLTQKKMSEQLGVPVNTLSRWETGATTPDADSLAAVHSLAVGQGYTPGFFRKSSKVLAKPKATISEGNRHVVIVMLDFQNLGVSAGNVNKLTAQIKSEVASRFPAVTRTLLKAFVQPNQQAAADELERLGWRVWEDSGDWDEDIILQSKSDCGKNPKQTVLLLVTRDGDFAELAQHLGSNGVSVYGMGPKDTSRKLVQAVSKKHWIPWPF